MPGSIKFYRKKKRIVVVTNPIASGSTTTLNPLDKSPSVNLSNGNLSAVSSGHNTVRANRGKSSGKWHWEVRMDSSSGAECYGIATSAASLETYVGSEASSWCICPQQNAFYTSNAGVGSGITYPGGASGYVFSFDLDMDAKNLYISDNHGFSMLIFSGFTGTIFPAISTYGGTATVNFGASAWTIAPRAGHIAIN